TSRATLPGRRCSPAAAIASERDAARGVPAEIPMSHVGRIFKGVLTRSPRRQILTTVDMRDAVLTLPVFGTLGRKRSEVTDPGQFAPDANLPYRAYSFRGVPGGDCPGDAAARHAVIRQWGAAGTAKVPLCDVRAHEGRRVPARPAQVFALDTRERHEWL